MDPSGISHAEEHKQAFAGSRVLVTGGAGFIGTNLVHALDNLGADVTVLDLPSADFSVLPRDAHVIRGDLLDRSWLEGALPDCEFIFHLAARTDLGGRTLQEYAANHDGTRNLIEASHKRGLRLERFIFFSTQLVVGIFDEKRFIGPSEPYRTKTLYGASKIAAEQIVVERCNAYNTPYTIMRPTSVYGPFGREPYRDFFLTIKNRRYFHIGNAENLVSMAYVKNVVDQALFLALNKGAQEQVFFSNDFHPYTMREFSDAAAYFGYHLRTIPDIIVYPAAYAMGVLKWLGFNMPLYPFRLRNIRASYCYDIGNLVTLGYSPRYGLEQGMTETLHWYIENDPAFPRMTAGWARKWRAFRLCSPKAPDYDPAGSI